jgi:hypothetical protein
MKALKIIGGIILTLALAVGIFWLGWLTPPSADDVCANVAQLTKKEKGVELPASVKEQCVRAASTPPKYGRMPWVKELKCMRDAESLSALDACGSRRR